MVYWSTAPCNTKCPIKIHILLVKTGTQSLLASFFLSRKYNYCWNTIYYFIVYKKARLCFRWNSLYSYSAVYPAMNSGSGVCFQVLVLLPVSHFPAIYQAMLFLTVIWQNMFCVLHEHEWFCLILLL